METRKSELYLPDLSQSYNSLQLGAQAGPAAEYLENLITQLQHSKNTREIHPSILSASLNRYLLEILKAMDLYALPSANYGQAVQFVRQTFQALKAFKKEFSDLGQE